MHLIVLGPSMIAAGRAARAPVPRALDAFKPRPALARPRAATLRRVHAHAATAVPVLEDGESEQAQLATAVTADAAPTTLFSRAATAAGVVYRFSRPHTILGTAISVLSVSALALGPAHVTAGVAVRVGAALVAALLMNVCIVGVNQVYDVEIDRVSLNDEAGVDGLLGSWA